MNNSYIKMVSALTTFLKTIHGVKVVSYKSKVTHLYYQNHHPTFLEATGHVFYIYRNKRFIVKCPMHMGMDYGFAYVTDSISTTQKIEKLTHVFLYNLKTSGPKDERAWSQRVFYPLTHERVKQAVLRTFELSMGLQHQPHRNSLPHNLH